MFRNLLFLLCIVATSGMAAEVYRWKDERGVTQYSEKPPENRPSTRVDARPAAASVDAEGKLLDPPKPVAQPVPQLAVAPPQVPVPQQPAVRGMDFGVYMYLRRGMSEGEILLRAGRPDHETFEGGRNFVVKSLYYYPTLSDPYITLITLRGGRVADIERTRKSF